jgi:superfamily II DNA or RNA helicase
MLTPLAIVTYVGRMVHVQPHELGGLFHDHCTVNLRLMDPAGPHNKYKAGMVTKPQREYWYTKDPNTGQHLFCTHSGFGPHIVEALKARGVPVEERDFMPSGLEAPVLGALAGVSWRGSQLDVLCKMMAHRCGVVQAPTGFGKTFVTSLITRVYPTSTIIVTVPSVDIAKDFYKELHEWDGTVGMVGAGHHNPQRVTVAVSHSLKHCRRDANLLIGDEVHALVSEGFRANLLMFPRAKFLGLSATTEGRHDNGDKYIEALFGPLIAEVPYQEAVNTGNVVPLDCWVVPLPEGPNVSKLRMQHIKDRTALWGNQIRNRAIARSVEYAEARVAKERACAPKDVQILVMVDKTEHAYRLQQLLPGFEVVTGQVTPETAEEFMREGIMQDWQKLCSPKEREQAKQNFAAGKIKRVISTFVWSKGVNFLDLDVLVRADGLGSQIQASQVPGRLSRLGTDGKKVRGVLVDFYDLFSPDMKRRSEERFRSYKQNGWTIEKVQV